MMQLSGNVERSKLKRKFCRKLEIVKIMHNNKFLSLYKNCFTTQIKLTFNEHKFYKMYRNFTIKIINYKPKI